MTQQPIQDTTQWKNLLQHVNSIAPLHLRDLLQDQERCNAMTAEHQGILLDYSRQNATTTTMDMLFDLAEAAGLKAQLDAMSTGAPLNSTENRAVLHMALRAPPLKPGDESNDLIVDGRPVNADVHAVLRRIRAFSSDLRSGTLVGATGKPLKNVISVGIGGSYLGPEFVFEALRHDRESGAEAGAQGRTLRFLANVDPVDVARATSGLDPEETLVIVISKTFTTAETMLNAKTIRKWLVDAMSSSATDQTIVSRHIVAVSAAVDRATAFGIEAQNIFGFWDWVGGRYSVSSAVGILPLSCQYGYDVCAEFLAGAHDMDQHLLTAPFRSNLPVLMGLLGIWNTSFLGHTTRALLPYSQALLRFAAHVQQVDMESNGKRVRRDGSPLPPGCSGEIDFGEAGTNGQHSFYQLIHQGRVVVPCDFLGFCESQHPIALEGETVSNHDELMSNFFAQADALACGKSIAELRAEGVPPHLQEHKFFPGNRPSSSLLFRKLNAFSIGQILALYEHRTVVQGTIWGLNSFDQWGVELGKVLAKQVRKQLHVSRKDGDGDEHSSVVKGFNASTTKLIERYLSVST